MALDDKINDACHRIEELYYETDGKCYVSFSGGKDSTVLLALVKMCEELYTIPQGGIPAVFSNTGIELGVTVEFVKWVKENWYPNVVVIHPERSFDWVVKNNGKPIRSKLRSKLLDQYHTKPTEACKSLLIKGETMSTKRPAKKSRLADKDFHMLHQQFDIHASWECCNVMKKHPMAKYETDSGKKGCAIGLRMEEGGVRELSAKNRVATNRKLCTYTKGKTLYKMPIIDWSNDEVEQFIKKNNVPLSKAYTEFGFERTGCMACPYSSNLNHDLNYLYYHEQNRYKAAMHWLKDVYIAENVILPFDEAYEAERVRMWKEKYEPMRQEMLRKYRPNSRLIKEYEQTDIFDFMGVE